MILLLTILAIACAAAIVAGVLIAITRGDKAIEPERSRHFRRFTSVGSIGYRRTAAAQLDARQRARRRSEREAAEAAELWAALNSGSPARVSVVTVGQGRKAN